MASTNPITGDAIRSKMASKEYEDNFDRIFRKPDANEPVPLKSTHGGKRQGAGRKPVSINEADRRQVRMTLPFAMYVQLKRLGGAQWVRRKLLEEMQSE